MVVYRQLHIGEIIDGCRRIEIHDVAADPVFCNFASRKTLVELALLALGKHIVVDWASRQV